MQEVSEYIPLEPVSVSALTPMEATMTHTESQDTSMESETTNPGEWENWVLEPDIKKSSNESDLLQYFEIMNCPQEEIK